jgi:hypothetical protein
VNKLATIAIGVLSATPAGLIEDIRFRQEDQRTPPPLEHCGDCGFLHRWDDRLQIWQTPGR